MENSQRTYHDNGGRDEVRMQLEKAVRRKHVVERKRKTSKSDDDRNMQSNWNADELSRTGAAEQTVESVQCPTDHREVFGQSRGQELGGIANLLGRIARNASEDVR